MTTAVKTPTPAGLPTDLFNRVLEEGYGPGAWYGSDLRAAVADVKAGDAFKRPAKGAHSVAEIALHHAYWSREIVKKLTGQESKVPFPLEGEDWFALGDGATLSWTQIVEVLEAGQHQLARTVSAIAAGKQPSPLSEAERFDVVLGITGHAAYHAGQIQLVKKLI